MKISPTDLATVIDHTNLHLDASEADIERLCAEAIRHSFAAVMIYPTDVPLAAGLIRDTSVKVGTVAGFPSGRFSTAAKEAEIETAARNGAHEIDVVMNHAALRASSTAEVERELTRLVAAARQAGLLIKVIAETCCLNREQKLAALRMCEDAGADFIKTSTGFGTAGATAADINLWRKHRRGTIRIKAAGGIRTLEDAVNLLQAGAERLGTSTGVALITAAAGAPADSIAREDDY